MDTRTFRAKYQFLGSAERNARNWLPVLGSILLLLLCWLIVKPFLPAVCWAFGLALIAQPVHRWLCRKLSRRNLAAAISLVVIAVVLVTPAIVLTRVLVLEATDFAQQFASEQRRESFRSEMNSNSGVQTVVDWLGLV
jgi:predicted PurR-regulated permease PerM